MLSSASLATIGAQNTTLIKIRELYDIIFEKDNKIQELEEKIDEMGDINKKYYFIFLDFFRFESDLELYNFKTQISALNMNLKNNKNYVSELEDSNMDLKK